MFFHNTPPNRGRSLGHGSVEPFTNKMRNIYVAKKPIVKRITEGAIRVLLGAVRQLGG
jgi:hypothetical protein